MEVALFVNFQTCLGKKLRALLYENNMSMEEVNLQIERETIQESLGA